MNELTGLRVLVGLNMRRDRTAIVVWITGIVAMVLLTVSSVKGLYPTQAELDKAADAMGSNAAVVGFNGAPQALNTVGGQVAFQVGAIGMVVVALMSLLMVGRMTRGEEDAGRLELVRSMAVGRRAPAAAALLVVVAMNVIIGALVTVGLAGMHLALGGSLMLGTSYALLGILFTAVAAVAAQISENPRVVYGSSAAVLGAAFAIRGVGDIGGGTVSWLSPIGWAQKARPFAGEQWWPLLLPAIAAGGVFAMAAVLAARRDLGAGLIAPRPGPPTAAPRLGRPVGLAVRMQRGSVIGWSVALLVLGSAFGWMGDDVEGMLGDSKASREIFASSGGADLTDAYLSTTLLMLTLMTAAFAIATTLRLRGEETALRAEPLLATPTPRSRWVAGHLTVALGGTLIILGAAGLGMGLGYGIVSRDAGQVPRLVGAALLRAPAAWLLAAVAVGLFGLMRHAAAVAWAILTGCIVVTLLGEVLKFPGWVQDLSPFRHGPQLPGGPANALPTLLLVAIAAALAVIGLIGFARRDIG